MTSICRHKQRIGCALTALPGCCSCADKRPLATAYPVYIDGQGMKLQGKRWQRYCWKCRDYWNLLSESNSDPSFSNTPETGNAHVCLQHGSSHGVNMPYYRNSRYVAAHNSGGTGSSPASGFSSTSEDVSIGNPDGNLQTTHFSPNSAGVSINHPSSPNHSLPAREPPTWAFGHVPPHARNTLQGTIPDGPAHSAPTHPAQRRSLSAHLNPLSQTTDGINSSQIVIANDPRLTITTPRPINDTSRQQPSNPRGRRPIPNPFGTREEIESENYQSPITALFGRAWNRYRDVQEANQSRRISQDSVPGTAPPQHDEAASRMMRERDYMIQLELAMREVGPLNALDPQWRPPPTNPAGTNLYTGQQFDAGPSTPVNQSWRPTTFNRAATYQNIGQQLNAGPSNPRSYQWQPLPINPAGTNQNAGQQPDPDPINPIDLQKRPPPITPDDMNVNVACKICCEQKIDTLFEPCMHLAVCHWCSDVLRTRARHFRNTRVGPPRPEEIWTCPICRREVTRWRRVYLAC
ncbi:hypothetical protein PV05_10360 [Exophiala xenobiotica]|uniref:RING-type domain-containing protein n=1 Tax=Exophiala xenobiotica TaxID=348802 RepID=A0A0D2BHC9_9EURO|nr:uncharacterized protein PV05_10360 [Exophiala xenobiotica]KIW51661.1 hypothetical protein PV05_10360 [Exophiala xenobiotica]